jgi:DNA (cytosine-5)-methyltransferase 1
MTAYYNEIDPFAAQWLRNLITAGHIAPGEVDTRSIEDVKPDDLRNFTQCHFFAGIGGWSHALRLAGWPDDHAVWTGSCPCQPFSQAGEGGGFADERHLWPAWFHLIGERRPSVIFGEQVEAAIAHGWLDLVQDDLEGIDYAFAPVGVPAASVGAPHIRHRLWWVANNNQIGRERTGKARRRRLGPTYNGTAGSLANGNGRTALPEREQSTNQRNTEPCGSVGDSLPAGLPLCQSPELQGQRGGHEGRAAEQSSGAPIAGSWANADWIACTDGKARPVEPGTFPLAPRLPNHVGRLRAYGNSIVPEVAAEVIGSFMEFSP